MKSAVTVQELRDQQTKTEKGTKQAAQNDKGGDWGKAPNSRFTRRTITTGIGNQPVPAESTK